MMMMMMTSVIVGPFGNYLVPLMIGSKRVAFPRLEALSFWLTPCAYVILLSSFLRRRVPDRLDRLRAAVHPGRRGHGRVRGRVRPDGRLDHPGRLQHHRHDHLLPGARHALVPAADVRLGDAHHRLPARAGRAGARRRHVHDHHRPDGADRVLRRPARRSSATCTRTCSGSSATPRCTSWRCRASASCPSSSRSSPGSRCSATRSARRACSASRSCRSSSGSTTCSTPAWTRTCGRCSC